MVFRLRKVLGGLNEKIVGVLGLSFKPNTDDIREAPALEVIHLLENEGALIKGYDPQAMPAAKKQLKGVTFCDNPYQVAEGADALVLATEWNEFKQLDFARIFRLMRNPVIMDGRNLWDPAKIRSFGFKYYGVGRGYERLD